MPRGEVRLRGGSSVQPGFRRLSGRHFRSEGSLWRRDDIEPDRNDRRWSGRRSRQTAARVERKRRGWRQTAAQARQAVLSDPIWTGGEKQAVLSVMNALGSLRGATSPPLLALCRIMRWYWETVASTRTFS